MFHTATPMEFPPAAGVPGDQSDICEGGVGNLFVDSVSFSFLIVFAI